MLIRPGRVGMFFRPSDPPLPIYLRPLRLNSNDVDEGVAAGTIVGQVLPSRFGGQIVMTDNAGGRFALSGNNIVTTGIAIDYEATQSLQIELQENLPGTVNTGRRTQLTIFVNDVAEAIPPALLAGKEPKIQGRLVNGVPVPMVGERVTVSDGEYANGVTGVSKVWVWDDDQNGTPVTTQGFVDFVSANVGRSIRAKVTASNASGSSTTFLTPAYGPVIPFHQVITLPSTVEAILSVGLGSTPDFVPIWSLPATFEDGVAAGLIPTDAIRYDKGNAGKAFSSVDAWMDACVAADKPGAIGSGNYTVLCDQRYCPRGIYGFGPTKPKFTDSQTPSTSTAFNSSSARAWLFPKHRDIVARGIDWTGIGVVFGTTRPTLPLSKKNSAGDIVIYAAPYSTSTNKRFLQLNSNPANWGGTTGGAGAALAVPMLRVGKIRLSGTSGSITAVATTRQKQGTYYGLPVSSDPDWTANGGTVDSVWASRLDPDSPALISGTVAWAGSLNATAAALANAINAGTATHGTSAEAVGSDVLLTRTGQIGGGDFLVITPATTGGLIATANTRGVDIDVSYCDFNDSDTGIAALLDVVEMGMITTCKNKGVGSWALHDLQCTRWRGFRDANNDWGGCSRAYKNGSRRMPNVNGVNGVGTYSYAGTNQGVHLRYSAYSAKSWCNYIHDIEGLGITDTTNSGNAYDWRSCRAEDDDDDTSSIKYNRIWFVWNSKGHEDSNVFYGKVAGLTMAYNHIKAGGSPWISDTDPTKNNVGDGSETTIALFKEPGRTGGDRALKFFGNTVEDAPRGIPAIKVDNYANCAIYGNRFVRWMDTQPDGSYYYGSAARTGYVKIIGLCDTALRVHSNLFVDMIFTTSFAINFYNDALEYPATASAFKVHNNVCINSGQTYAAPAIPSGEGADHPSRTYDGVTFAAHTTSRALIQFQKSLSSGTYANAMVTGRNKLRNANDNADVGTMTFTGNYQGDDDAPADPWSNYQQAGGSAGTQAEVRGAGEYKTGVPFVLGTGSANEVRAAA